MVQEESTEWAPAAREGVAAFVAVAVVAAVAAVVAAFVAVVTVDAASTAWLNTTAWGAKEEDDDDDDDEGFRMGSEGDGGVGGGRGEEVGREDASWLAKPP